jgi:hypothetical protein
LEAAGIMAGAVALVVGQTGEEAGLDAEKVDVVAGARGTEDSKDPTNVLKRKAPS